MDDATLARLADLAIGFGCNLQEGQIIRGRILTITPSEVIVDIGYKSEGIIPISEFTDYSGQVTVHEGDAVDVLLERTEDQNGYVVLSKDKAEKMKVWDEVEKAYRSGSSVKGRVIDRIKGGLAVDIGVKAFLPGSLVDVKPVKNLESLALDDRVLLQERESLRCGYEPPPQIRNRSPIRRRKRAGFDTRIAACVGKFRRCGHGMPPMPKFESEPPRFSAASASFCC